MAGGGEVGRVEAVRSVMRVDAALRVLQRQVAHGDEVGVVQVDQRTAAVTRDGREQPCDQRGVGRAGDGEALVTAHARADQQADIVAARNADRVDHRIVAGVDEQRVAGLQVIGPEHIDRVGLGHVGCLAREAVAAQRRGRVSVARVALVVGVVVLAVLGHAEGFLRTVDHRRHLGQRDLDAQVLGVEIDAAVGRDPDEVAVVGRGRGDVDQQPRAVGRVLQQVDAHRRIGGVVGRHPTDGQRLALLPVGVQVGELQLDAWHSIGRGLMRAGAVGAQVGDVGIADPHHEAGVEPDVVGAAGVAVGVEAQHGEACTGGRGDAVADQFPTAVGVQCVHRLAAEFLATCVEEDQRHGARIARRLGGRAHAPAEGQVQQPGVDLGSAEAPGQQVDALLGEALLHRAGAEVLRAFVGRGCAGLQRGAGVDGPAGSAGLETGVVDQVEVMRRCALVDQHVGRVGVGAAEALAGHHRKQPVVGPVQVHELRARPVRVDHGGADRVQVVAGHVGLPVEHVGEILGPVDQLAGAGLVEVVVVAEEAGLRIVGHEDVVAGLGPEDVALDLDVGRARLQPQVVAAGGVQGVLVDADVAGAAQTQAGHGIAVNHVVPDLQAVHRGGDLDADGVVGDLAVLHRAAEGRDAGGIGLDQVGQVQRRAADHTAAADAHRAARDMLALELRAHRLDAGGIAVDVVDTRAGDKTEPVNGACHGGADAHRAVVHGIAGQRGCGVVAHADLTADDVVVVDQAAKDRRDGQPGGAGIDLVVVDAALCRHLEREAHTGRTNAVVADGQAHRAVTRRALHHDALRDGVVVDQAAEHRAADAQRAIDGVGGDLRSAATGQQNAAHGGLGQRETIDRQRRDVAAGIDALQQHVVGVDDHRAVDRRIGRADDHHAGVLRRDHHVTADDAVDDDGVARAQRIGIQDGLDRIRTDGIEAACDRGRHAAGVDLGLAAHRVLPHHRGAARAVGGGHQLHRPAAGFAQATGHGFAWQLLGEVAGRVVAQRVQVGGCVVERLALPQQAQRITATAELRRRGHGRQTEGVDQRQRACRGIVKTGHGDAGALVRKRLPGDEQLAVEISHAGLGVVADAAGQPRVGDAADTGAAN